MTDDGLAVDGTHGLNPLAVEQVDRLHRVLFGWPADRLTPMADLVASDDLTHVARKMLNSERFRWDMRGIVPLWPCDKWVCTDAFGLRVWVNLHDGYVSWGVLHDNWENEEVGFVLRHLEPGDTFLDIGANVGVYTLQAARAVGPEGRVFSIEPRADTCTMLRRSIVDNGFEGRCTVFNVALGASEMLGDLNTRHDPLNPGATYISLQQGGSVRVCPLDSLEIPSDRPVKVLKMDIEGFEPLMMEGAQGFYRAHRPLVVTEMFPRAIRMASGCDAERYFDQFEGLGYRVHRLEQGEIGTRMDRGDISAITHLFEPINVVCVPE